MSLIVSLFKSGIGDLIQDIIMDNRCNCSSLVELVVAIKVFFDVVYVCINDIPKVKCFFVIVSAIVTFFTLTITRKADRIGFDKTKNNCIIMFLLLLPLIPSILLIVVLELVWLRTIEDIMILTNLVTINYLYIYYWLDIKKYRRCNALNDITFSKRPPDF